MACGSFGASLLALVGFSALTRLQPTFEVPTSGSTGRVPPPLVWGCPSVPLCPVAHCPQQGPSPARPVDASLLPMLPASCTGWEAPTAGAAGDTPPIPQVQPSEQPCSRAVGQHELTGSEEKDMAPGPPTSAGPRPASLWLLLKPIHWAAGSSDPQAAIPWCCKATSLLVYFV